MNEVEVKVDQSKPEYYDKQNDHEVSRDRDTQSTQQKLAFGNDSTNQTDNVFPKSITSNDLTGDNSKNQPPQTAEQSPPKTDMTDSTSQQHPESQHDTPSSKSGPDHEQEQPSSPDPANHIWDQLARIIRRNRFAVSRAEKAVKDTSDREATATMATMKIDDADETTATTAPPPPPPIHQNEPPIHGFTDTTLDPLSSLYQFDGSLARIQQEGYFKWLRRLNVRVIEIV